MKLCRVNKFLIANLKVNILPLKIAANMAHNFIRKKTFFYDFEQQVKVSSL